MADRSSKAGLMIVAAVVAAGAAALAVVFLWWMPRQDRAEARGQIADWERRWTATRGCLLGSPALAADPGEALALRELAAGVVHTDTSCTDGVRKLMRPAGAASPIEAVERSWAAVEAAIPALGEAYVMWISAESDERDAWLDKLGVAISALDAAQDELRRAAGLAQLTRTGSVTLTRLDAPAPVEVDGRALGALDAQIQAGAVIGQAFEGNATFELAIVDGAGRALPPHNMDQPLSLPDGAWGAMAIAAGTGASVVAGPVVGGVIDPATATVITPPEQPYVPLVALGAGAERSVLLESTLDEPLRGLHPLALARSTDSGKTWTIDADIAPADSSPGALRLDYRNGMADLELVVIDGGRLLHLDAAHPLDAVVPPTTWTDFGGWSKSCRRGASLWWSWGDGVGLLDGGTFTMVNPPTGDRVIDCTENAALVEESGTPVVYDRCDRQGCKEAMRGAAYSFGRAAMLGDGRVVYAAARGRVIAMWTEGDPEPRYFKLPSPLLLDAVVVWGGVPVALLHDPDEASQHLLSARLR